MHTGHTIQLYPHLTSEQHNFMTSGKALTRNYQRIREQSSLYRVSISTDLPDSQLPGPIKDKTVVT